MNIRVLYLASFLTAVPMLVVIAKADAQNRTNAVMEVSATVVSGIQSEIPDYTDITHEMLEAGKNLDLGTYSIKLPEGTDYLVSFDSAIYLKNEIDRWNIDTSMAAEINADGVITLTFEGISSTNGFFPGIYLGTQSTRIEYY